MSTEQVKVFEKAVLHSNQEEDWNYLSEGNKHIVFQYKKTEGILDSLILKINKDINESEDIFASNYIAYKWLGEEYVNKIIHPIHLSQSFVFELVNKIQKERAKKRRKKHPFHQMINKNNLIYHASLERNAYSLSVYHNENKQNENIDDDEHDDDDDNDDGDDDESKQENTLKGIFTFDMKPKWMFLNLSPFIDSNNIKKHICRFSMHQNLKFNVEKSIELISKYCPLSLLSNNLNVITKNINYLLIAHQTNFKIFDGNKEMKSYKEFKEYHIKAIASIIIKHNELFKRISMLQRLDKFDIEIIYEIWMELKSRNKLDVIQNIMKDTKILDEIIKELNEEYNKTNFENEKCFCCYDIEKIKQIVIDKNDKKDDKKENKMEINEFVKNSTDKQLLLYIAEYLLSTIFKDCQVLITINFNDIDNHKISVIDLYSKPKERIKNKWLKQDTEIVENYINMLIK